MSVVSEFVSDVTIGMYTQARKTKIRKSGAFARVQVYGSVFDVWVHMNRRSRLVLMLCAPQHCSFMQECRRDVSERKELCTIS